MLISLVVTTYNRPDALRAVLDGLGAQSDRDFEVRVADDGSRDDTRAVIAAYAASAPVPLEHLWQEDRGFRAGAARNRAAAGARGEYLVFIDGDCIPRPDFIARHRALAEPGWMVAGNRILLSEDFTRRALAERWPLHAWRRDFAAVNGFDEAYEGWGFEDSDLAVRLFNAGIRRKEGAFATGLLHLWHPENDRRFEARNLERLRARMASKDVRAAIGLATNGFPPQEPKLYLSGQPLSTAV